jgi:hypothetical protein
MQPAGLELGHELLAGQAQRSIAAFTIQVVPVD